MSIKELADMLDMTIPQIPQAVKTAGAITGAGLVGASAGVAVDRLKRFLDSIKQDNYESRLLNPTEIAIGYKYSSKYRIPIVLDMIQNPHMLVCGLSQQGKTKMVEYAIRNKKVVLINTFDTDFKSVKPIGKANGIEEMAKTLKYLAEEMDGNTEPVYVVIDEILEMVLSGNKDVSKYITRLLATAAHNKIYIIAISQSADKEIVKFKNLFNIRVCFRMRDDVNYKTALGFQPENIDLSPRQFIYAHTDVGYGFTYDV